TDTWDLHSSGTSFYDITRRACGSWTSAHQRIRFRRSVLLRAWRKGETLGVADRHKATPFLHCSRFGESISASGGGFLVNIATQSQAGPGFDKAQTLMGLWSCVGGTAQKRRQAAAVVWCFDAKDSPAIVPGALSTD